MLTNLIKIDSVSLFSTSFFARTHEKTIRKREEYSKDKNSFPFDIISYRIVYRPRLLSSFETPFISFSFVSKSLK